MNTYMKLFLRSGKKVILRNMQMKELVLPHHDLRVECYVGVEVNKDGDDVRVRYGGRVIDTRIHLIQASEVIRCQPMAVSLKYGWLVPSDEVVREIQERGIS